LSARGSRCSLTGIGVQADADIDDAAIIDRNVAAEPGTAGAVHHARVANQQVYWRVLCQASRECKSSDGKDKYSLRNELHGLPLHI
jgi:hypothetical protein